ncbi:MAG: NfeD family protein [Actinomycetaceae bacterium]|nr:NfeD family protein [Actinomycetaceae bacterium]
MSIWWWLIIALALAGVEVATADLIFLMFAGGAAAAGVSQLAGLGLAGQAGVFAVVSIVLLIFVRPWAKSFLQRKTPDIKTNAQALVGQTATVTKTLTASGGLVRLSGEIWTARLQHADANTALAVGTTVTVVEIDGATAVVASDADCSTPSPH